ncbi:serine hydrolase [Paenibacillus baekrokdamisoli]|uniref:Serine hydrolase n=1 Tax=Paenibacillus baekrokdamisoli TaxID=1712516 RepID=A0A3G9ISD0_9BACL|nr:serine hydrolase domain-containing protein [Paenibacillus baekrokdamisoli]MBB3071721.1 CubicO group peptidase (beta-lactamase class C family) [Paenibacillus baekrokdamisoli]BBH21770.1 serine hydrolase [Paenibacillus baekrokdamisoli]
MMETITLHHGRTEVTPEEVGFDSASLERLNDHYRSLIESKIIQGASYVLSRHGKVFAHAAMGQLTHKEESLDLLPDSIRKTYSITKIMTASAIMQLIERGFIYLHQPVSSILKQFDTPMHRDITIFHLLTHTSGLRADPGYYFEPNPLPWFEWAYHERKKMDPTTDWIQIILAGPVMAAPGREWHYSTAGYAVLGEIITRIAETPYHQYVQDEILLPLGMEHSFFIVPPAWREDVCITSSREENGLLVTELDANSPPRAGNGMYSTLSDLLRFGQMLLGGGTLDGEVILSRRGVELLTQNHLTNVRMQGWGNDEDNFRFGLGFSLEDFDLCTPGTFNHEGFGHCGLYVDPVEQMVFAFLVPSTRGYTTESVLVPKAIVWSGLL